MNRNSFPVFTLVAAGVAAAHFWNSYLGLLLFEVAVVVAWSLIDVRFGRARLRNHPAQVQL
jgi:hypothetical protein